MMRLFPAMCVCVSAAISGLVSATAIPEKEHLARLGKIEADGNFRDVRLVAPLVDLATVALADANLTTAIDAMERAAFILRAEFGVHSFEQFRHDELLMKSHFLAGDIEAVSDRLSVRRATLQKAEGVSQDFLQVLEADAKWQRMIGARRDEVATHFLRAQIVENVAGQHAPQLSSLYREAGKSLLRLFHTDAAELDFAPQRRQFHVSGLASELETYFHRLIATADNAFERALAVHTANPEVFDPRTTAELQALRGDSALALFRRTTATRHYRAAHDVIVAAEGEAGAQWSAQPTLQFVPETPGDLTQEFLQLGADSDAVLFTARVNRHGRATRLQWSDGFDTGQLSSRARRKFRQLAKSAIFRPGLERGQPVVAGIEITAGQLLAQQLRQLTTLAAAGP